MIEERIKYILAKILDVDKDELSPETDLLKDLAVESIDLLEIAISLEKEFKIKVDENALFLKSFRYHLEEAEKRFSEKERLEYLKGIFPFLSKERLKELSSELRDNIFPSVKIKDLVSYVKWMKKKI